MTARHVRQTLGGLCLAAAVLVAQPQTYSAALPTGARASGDAAVVEVHGMTRVRHVPTPNVVVWFDAAQSSRREPARAVLDQRNLAFSPQVQVVQVGAIVEFPNNDRVFHNVFSFRDGKVFDLGMYPVGTKRAVRFDKPGLSRIFCNIHPNMAAYVLAVDTPYFSVSDRSGAFHLSSVPRASTAYHAWRAGAPQLTGMWTPDESDLSIEWP